MKLRLGTRASELAVTQSEHVAQLLRQRGHEVELVRIKTRGDTERGSLTQLGSLGVFAAELRTAILDGRCDFAVHSLKDLPTSAVPGLTVAAVPPREDARDVLCAAGRSLTALPAGARVGTGSPRRVAQLRAVRPDLNYVDVRGNVGTRLARVAEGDLDGVVLAAAGLKRLGREKVIDDYLELLPAPGQGALALECRAEDHAVIAALAAVDDPATREAVTAERAVLASLGGGCAAPIGVHAQDGQLRAVVCALDGSAQASAAASLGPEATGEVVRQLLEQRADEITDLTATRPSRLAELHNDSALWGGSITLAGTHVLLPRADGPLAEGLRAAGAEVVACPVTRTEVLSGPPHIGTDWVAITSAQAVAAMQELHIELGRETKIAAVGQATARALTEAGYQVDLVPDGPSHAQALADAFPPGPGTVALPCSALAKQSLQQALEAKGFSVERHDIYTTQPAAEIPAEITARWGEGSFDAVVVTSGSVGDAVGKLLGWRDDVAVIAFGPPSRSALEQLGVPVAATADTQDVEGLIRAIGGQ